LFNRERELEQFRSTLDHAPIIVVTGLRRTGKTSFVAVALSETKHPHVFLDMRDLPTVPSRAEFVRKIEATFRVIDKKWLSTLLEVLKHVKGISVAGNEVSFDWSKKGVILAELVDKIDAWARKRKELFLLAFDEVQSIRGDKSIPRLLARIADVNRNIILIITGSEIGLLYDFLGFDEPNSPLYGRYRVEIKMSNFDGEQSKKFLEEGFEQIGVSCSDKVMEYAIQKLDGVVGWLTLFGARGRDARVCSEALVDEAVDEGGRLARAEALKMVRHSKRYGVILNFLAKVERAGWTSIKATLEAHEKRSLASSTFSELLVKLVKTGFVEKENGEYRIADPLLASGILKEPFRE
jgi:hypothetical protein